ncbi:MAG: gamma-glutamyl-gamma-aminobutyrate hydrolase family protein [Acetobacteraceae bacterium]|nr:gamma-glutamyl-gamma-aminobutyrate hydrolase family protein [Acetobacteraceae bacterium]
MPVLVGIPACSKIVGSEPAFSTPTRYVSALIGVTGAMPVLLPPVGKAMTEVLDRLDGLLVNGSRSNVHPTEYGVDQSQTPEMHDPARDGTTLPLIRAALERGMPLLCICRGIQELNVALGGTLHQQVHTLPGRADHRSGGPGELDYLFRMQHRVHVSGHLAQIVGASEITVNSLHEQAIDRLAEGLAVEAVADDGTIEGVRVLGATRFAFGVQYHPEWHWRTDAPSIALFRAFGAACEAYGSGLKQAA